MNGLQIKCIHCSHPINVGAYGNSILKQHEAVCPENPEVKLEASVDKIIRNLNDIHSDACLINSSKKTLQDAVKLLRLYRHKLDMQRSSV